MSKQIFKNDWQWNEGFKVEDVNEMDLQANKVHLQIGSLCFCAQKTTKQSWKEQLHFFLVLAELTANIRTRKDSWMHKREATKDRNEAQLGH